MGMDLATVLSRREWAPDQAGQWFLSLDRRSTVHARSKVRVGTAPLTNRHITSGESFRETELMAVGISDVEVPFTPRSVSGLELRRVACLDDPSKLSIDIADVEHDSAPQAPGDCRVPGRQVHVVVASPESGERSVAPSVNKIETDGSVEVDGTIHVVRSESDGANGIDRD